MLAATDTHRYRIACETLTFADFEYASAHETQQKLWAAHLKVNSIFRQAHKIVRHTLHDRGRSIH